MEVFSYLEMNILAIVVLFIILINSHHKSEKYLIEQKLYKHLLQINILILITDGLMWVLDGTKNTQLQAVLILSTLIYYILNPLICMVWSIYIDFQINRNEVRISKLIIPLSVPVVIFALLSLASIFSNCLYYYDSNFVYHRGRFFFLTALFTYSYLLYSFFSIIVKRAKIHKPYFLPILMFAILPSICGIIQFFCYGLSLIWIGTTISLLIVFINIQNEQMYIDYLTGLYNRRQLDIYLQDLLQKHFKSTYIGGIYIDVNSFKKINDHYGHSSGDEALRYTAKILKRSFDRNSFIARYGGDEFVVLLQMNDKNELAKAIDQLNETLNEFNFKKKTPYQLSFSTGSACYDKNSQMSDQEFLGYIDHLMYLDKQQANS